MTKENEPIYSVLNGKGGFGIACCGGNISLSGATRGNGCYVFDGNGGYNLDTRVLDEEGNTISGTIYYAYYSGSGGGEAPNGDPLFVVSFTAYDIMNLGTWQVSVGGQTVTGGVCPPVGTFAIEEGNSSGNSNINLTISCGC